MKRWINLNNRKKLYIILNLVVIFVFTLTIVYAALATTLKIVGNAEVTASSWDIYLDNVKLHTGSVTSNEPTISDKTTVSFTTTLNNPGDYYMFTIDVVNNGSIDAMIDGITKIPTLREEQAKYLNYIVEYESGESINEKQLVKANSFVRLKVKLEYRNDLVSTDLPNKSETLNLSFKVNYVQSDDSNTNVNINNNGKLIKIVSGDLNTVGSEICIKEECFYLMENDGINVIMLSKYNLYIDSKQHDDGSIPTGRQDSTVLGWFEGKKTIGAIAYSSTNYWGSVSKGTYVYNSNSLLYNYIENYRVYLESQGLEVDKARLIAYSELEKLGCNIEDFSCTLAPKWVYSTSYWTGSIVISDYVLDVFSRGSLGSNFYYLDYDYGVRPVIEISLENFN